ncbi:MAG: radical SAM protein [Deltaproteobacteria bacterium]|jgi:radical SAM protein with 4Fe4S-binding SPASM domain|nr:radical SAM protein [Deltaproteobacteria bacterium]
MTEQFARESLADLDPALIKLVSLHPWNSVAGWILPPDRADISFSPSYTPLEALGLLSDFLPPEDGRLDSFVEGVVRRRAVSMLGRPGEPPFVPDAAADPRDRIMYHGSGVTDLEILRGEPLFVSPSPAVAACFGLPLDSGKGWIHGVDHLSGSMPVPYLVVPPGEEWRLSEPMALYHVNGGGSVRPAGELRGYEYASSEPLRPLGKVLFPSVGGAMEEYGVQVGLHGQVRFDPSLREAAVPLRAEVEAYLGMPLEAVFSVPALEASLYLYLTGLGGLAADGFAIPPRILRHVLDRVILLATFPFMTMAGDGFHGLAHARETARAAALIACTESMAPLAPMLAACLHDAARKDDAGGERHAADGARLAELFLETPAGRGLPLSEKDRRSVVSAIAGHASPSRTHDPVGACLQDADRLRLSWSDGLKPEMFTTSAGLALASHGPGRLANDLAFLDRLGYLEESGLEVKVEITDACDMACSFCHQGFGSRSGGAVMALAEFSELMDRVSGEGIGSVRLTGGEPLTVPELPEYLDLAKRKGLNVTLNTNALSDDGHVWEAILDSADCLKISLPAPDEKSTAATVGVSGAFERKIEAAALAAARGVSVEFLTPMYPEAISGFARFARLLHDMPFVRWVPLRAEPSPGNSRPVSRDDMLALLERISLARYGELSGKSPVTLPAESGWTVSPEACVTLQEESGRTLLRESGFTFQQDPGSTLSGESRVTLPIESCGVFPCKSDGTLAGEACGGVPPLDLGGEIDGAGEELSHKDRFEDLKLYLGVPFCLLDSPSVAVILLEGRQGCGPLRSLTVAPDGSIMQCYSRREPLDVRNGMRKAAMTAAWEDFQALPDVCRSCPVAYSCMGGCRCAQALTRGGFDYLARPGVSAGWQAEREGGGRA